MDSDYETFTVGCQTLRHLHPPPQSNEGSGSRVVDSIHYNTSEVSRFYIRVLFLIFLPFSLSPSFFPSTCSPFFFTLFSFLLMGSRPFRDYGPWVVVGVWRLGRSNGSLRWLITTLDSSLTFGFGTFLYLPFRLLTSPCDPPKCHRTGR